MLAPRWKSPRTLLGRGHRRRRHQWQPLGLAARSANFYFFKEERRRDNRSRQTVLRGAKSAESRARESVYLALHVVIDVIIVADSRDIANRAGVQSYDASAADNLF